MIEVTVPCLFWESHEERAPYDNPADFPRMVKRSIHGKVVVVSCTPAGLAGLLADARYYANSENMDECPRWLRESARRAVASITQAVQP